MCASVYVHQQVEESAKQVCSMPCASIYMRSPNALQSDPNCDMLDSSHEEASPNSCCFHDPALLLLLLEIHTASCLACMSADAIPVVGRIPPPPPPPILSRKCHKTEYRQGAEATRHAQCGYARL